MIYSCRHLSRRTVFESQRVQTNPDLFRLGDQLAEVLPNSVPTDGVFGNDSRHPDCQDLSPTGQDPLTPVRGCSPSQRLPSVGSFLHAGSGEDGLVLRGHPLCSILYTSSTLHSGSLGRVCAFSGKENSSAGSLGGSEVVVGFPLLLRANLSFP